MASKVYLVTSGVYSDYEVHAVFSSEELAQLYIDSETPISPYSHYSIEEYDLDSPSCGKRIFNVEMNKRGDTKFVKPFDLMPMGASITLYRIQDKTNFLEVFCYAHNEDHAVKIANEKRIELIVLDKWDSEYINIEDRNDTK